MYIVRDRQAGNNIESFDTLEEAEKALADYEEQDKADGTYEKDFYEIATYGSFKYYETVTVSGDDEWTYYKGYKKSEALNVLAKQHNSKGFKTEVREYKVTVHVEDMTEEEKTEMYCNGYNVVEG